MRDHLPLPTLNDLQWRVHYQESLPRNKIPTTVILFSRTGRMYQKERGQGFTTLEERGNTE